jgi:hypothetical protein
MTGTDAPYDPQESGTEDLSREVAEALEKRPTAG